MGKSRRSSKWPDSIVPALSRVFGSKPPASFLDELVDWALLAPDEIFLPNAIFDIYSSVVTQLGPYGAPCPSQSGHARSFASFLQGVKPCGIGITVWTPARKSRTRVTMKKTGAFQCSADSMDLDKGLKDFVQATLGATDDTTFRSGTKSNHKFAIEYAARLLRVSVIHHGTIKHHHIHPRTAESRRGGVSGLSGEHRRLSAVDGRRKLRLN